MKRPSFQFYPKDWQGNAKLKRCKPAERSYWLDVMCLMHDSVEYGVLRWPLREIAQAVGCSPLVLRGLADKCVLKGSDTRIDDFVFVPMHAGKKGPAVTLLAAQEGPVWYCSRMVRDEYIRSKRGEQTRFGEQPDATPKGSPIPPFGDGPSSSSASAKNPLSTPTGVEAPDGARSIPDCPHQKIIDLYHETMPLNPRVLEWTDTRQGHLRARWREKALPNGRTQGYTTVDAGLSFWRRFFGYCAESKFLTGQADAKPGKPPFCPNLDWLLKPENFAKVLEGNYHR